LLLDEVAALQEVCSDFNLVDWCETNTLTADFAVWFKIK